MEITNRRFKCVKKASITKVYIISINSWIKKWNKLYKECFKYSDIIILETNNDIEGTQLNLFVILL